MNGWVGLGESGECCVLQMKIKVSIKCGVVVLIVVHGGHAGV